MSKFKVGDIIRVVRPYEGGLIRVHHKLHTVRKTVNVGSMKGVYVDEETSWLSDDHYELHKPAPIPHKHAALIKQWADGAAIEVQMKESLRWVETGNPDWLLYCDYRVKPEPKPDVVVYSYHGKGIMCNHGSERTATSNVKFTYDGETDKLKTVELL